VVLMVNINEASTHSSLEFLEELLARLEQQCGTQKARVLMHLADALGEAEMYADAELTVSQAREIYVSYEQWSNVAECYYKAATYLQAAREFRAAIDRAEQGRRLYLDLGYSHQAAWCEALMETLFNLERLPNKG
jgi:tetratricopeptide (TPR) repeat protein